MVFDVKGVAMSGLKEGKTIQKFARNARVLIGIHQEKNKIKQLMQAHQNDHSRRIHYLFFSLNRNCFIPNI